MQIEDAVILAAEMHREQKDKAGQPYLLHVLAVLSIVTASGPRPVVRGDAVVQEAAVLHDVLEDTHLTSADLIQRGVSAEAVDLIEAVSRRRGELYTQYIERIVGHSRDAVLIKLADMTHNAGRLADLPDVKVRDRLTGRYAEMLPQLHNALRLWNHAMEASARLPEEKEALNARRVHRRA